MKELIERIEGAIIGWRLELALWLAGKHAIVKNVTIYGGPLQCMTKHGVFVNVSVLGDGSQFAALKARGE